MPITACAKIVKYAPTTCTPVPGGIARIAIGDPTLWDFTQASPVSGVPQPYTAITDLGTSSKLYPVSFIRNKAKYEVDQKNPNGSLTSYNHKVSFEVPDLNMLTMQWASLTDIQGYCCGCLVVIITNSGRILIMGEASVNTNALPVPFYTYQDGSKGTTGMKFDEQNSYNAVITGDYNRPLIEYTGTAASIIALF